MRNTLFAVPNTVPCKSLWTIKNEKKKKRGRNCLFAVPNTVPCDSFLARVRETKRDREREGEGEGGRKRKRSILFSGRG